MWPDATASSGAWVRLEPMTVEHVPALLEAAEHAETFRYFSRVPEPWSVEGMERYCRALIDDGTVMPFVVRLARDLVVPAAGGERVVPEGTVAGSTTYLDLRPQHLGAEIGWTWYAPWARATTVNPACKLMLLRHAFGTPGLFGGAAALRVQLRTDARNRRSRAAILKLGAVFEGVLRKQVVMPDGFRRDTAMYSITEAEWSRVERGLEARVEGADARSGLVREPTPPGGVRVRRARPEDLPAIAEIVHGDPINRSRGDSAPEEATLRRALDAIDAVPGVGMFVAEVEAGPAGRRVVGCVQLSIVPGLGRTARPRATVETVFVHPDHQRRGVGRAMMAWAIDRAREAECGLVQLTTDLRRSEAKRFYERLGFEHTHSGMKLKL